MRLVPTPLPHCRGCVINYHTNTTVDHLLVFLIGLHHFHSLHLSERSNLPIPGQVRVHQNSHCSVVLNQTLLCSILNKYIMKQNKAARTFLFNLTNSQFCLASRWHPQGGRILALILMGCCPVFKFRCKLWFIAAIIVGKFATLSGWLSPSSPALFCLLAKPDPSLMTSLETLANFFAHFFLLASTFCAN